MSLNLFKSLLVFLLLAVQFADAKPLKKEIVGTWEITGSNVSIPSGVVAEFEKNKKGTLGMADESGDFKWKIKGNKLTISSTEDEMEITLDLEIKGDELTAIYDGQEFYAKRIEG